jgi:hypothetical protein
MDQNADQNMDPDMDQSATGDAETIVVPVEVSAASWTLVRTAAALGEQSPEAFLAGLVAAWAAEHTTRLPAEDFDALVAWLDEDAPEGSEATGS